MTDIIIIPILIIIVFIAFRSAKKHFKGEGGCCGGSTYKVRKKKLENVSEKKVFDVEGMSCKHCVNRVMEAVNSIDGASAEVNLKKGTVTVSTNKSIDDSIIRNAIEKAGYTVK